MTTQEAVKRLKNALNRPDADDFFRDPDDFLDALTQAQTYYYRLVAQHYPDLLFETNGPIASTDGGETYDLGQDHLGQMEVWTPPGPPKGDIITPALPEMDRFGYFVKGQTLYLTRAEDYSPGIYVRWVPASAPDIDKDNDPALPTYFDEALINRAAYLLSSKPGFLGDPNFYRERARNEWEGDPESMSDSGILGILSKQSSHGGYDVLGQHRVPWYKSISEGS